jgi:hypothetical protein
VTRHRFVLAGGRTDGDAMIDGVCCCEKESGDESPHSEFSWTLWKRQA